MLTGKMQAALNEQVNKEMYSAYLYLAMAAACAENGLPGCAHWMQAQAQEEMTHAMKLYEYVLQKGGSAELSAIDKPDFVFTKPAELFERVLEHEQLVTSLINNLMDVAIEEKDHATRIFLQWFVTEQVEEEANAQEIIGQFRLAGEQLGNLMMIDSKLGARPQLFTMPVV